MARKVTGQVTAIGIEFDQTWVVATSYHHLWASASKNERHTVAEYARARTRGNREPR